MRSILVWQYELTIYEQNEVSHCQAAQAYIALGRGEGKMYISLTWRSFRSYKILKAERG